MIAIDLFCGAGGLTRGLVNAGISVTVGIDNNPDCRVTYEMNNRQTRFMLADIREVDGACFSPYIGQRDRAPLLLAGCAPCQPFSTHQRTQRAAGHRNLLAEVSRLAAELNPEWVLIENVPGLARVKGRSTYNRFLSSLEKLQYQYAVGVLDAKQYGVPQTRRRLVLIASRTHTPSLPAPTHGGNLTPYRTVRDAIAHLPRLEAGQRHPSIPNHSAARLEGQNLDRMKSTPPDGGGRTHWPSDLVLRCHKDDRKGHEDAYGRMRWDSPAPTLTCRCFSISNGRYGHPVQHRAISLREAACLQAFPVDYAFFGPTQQSLGDQIGNAVPVQLAEVVGRHILGLCSQS